MKTTNCIDLFRILNYNKILEVWERDVYEKH